LSLILLLLELPSKYLLRPLPRSPLVLSPYLTVLKRPQLLHRALLLPPEHVVPRVSQKAQGFAPDRNSGPRSIFLWPVLFFLRGRLSSRHLFFVPWSYVLDLSSLQPGLHNPFSGLASADTGSVVIGSLVTGPVPSGSGVVPSGIFSAEGHQQAAPKRSRLSKPKAAPVPPPASCASGA
jgi:hypothetical protein